MFGPVAPQPAVRPWLDYRPIRVQSTLLLSLMHVGVRHQSQACSRYPVGASFASDRKRSEAAAQPRVPTNLWVAIPLELNFVPLCGCVPKVLHALRIGIVHLASNVLHRRAVRETYVLQLRQLAEPGVLLMSFRPLIVRSDPAAGASIKLASEKEINVLS